MSEQPERPIEKLLRASGKQRLPTERFELHPANRRLLQAEVAGVYAPKKPKQGRFSLLTLTRLAWSLGALAIVVVATWLIIPGSNRVAPDSRLARTDVERPSNGPSSLAQQTSPPKEPAPAATADQSLAAPPTSSANQSLALLDARREVQSQPAAQTDNRALVVMNSAENDLAKTMAKAETVAAPATAAPALAARALSGSAPAASAVATPASATNAYAYGLASTENKKDRSPAAATQKFLREGPTFLKATKDLPVMASFQFEQAGAEVRIIDQDGSVYIGSATPAPMATAFQAARRAGSVNRTTDALQTTRPNDVQNPSGFLFHVTGTNRTLQQPVVFDGQWTGLTNLAGSWMLTNASVGGIFSSAPARPTNSRISGSLTVGAEHGVLINAVSTGP